MIEGGMELLQKMAKQGGFQRITFWLITPRLGQAVPMLLQPTKSR